MQPFFVCVRLSEWKEGDLEGAASPESPVSHGNGVDQDIASLSMAEIASCSYEARYNMHTHPLTLISSLFANHT